ncbi:pentapeptide repeat-containing protein [Piscicoccus intestinalis]|uniref:pentapeptide repeat-containing protein n=1 Tax=Piscicoccus intestinalis TaxID=746033 RepID=UPI000A079E94
MTRTRLTRTRLTRTRLTRTRLTRTRLTRTRLTRTWRDPKTSPGRHEVAGMWPEAGSLRPPTARYLTTIRDDHVGCLRRGSLQAAFNTDAQNSVRTSPSGDRHVHPSLGPVQPARARTPSRTPGEPTRPRDRYAGPPPARTLASRALAAGLRVHIAANVDRDGSSASARPVPRDVTLMRSCWIHRESH